MYWTKKKKIDISSQNTNFFDKIKIKICLRIDLGNIINR